jgi:acyl phosphate:glycerol-3-phosphate acyltransferase
MTLLLVCALAYLAGSIPFGLLLTRAAGLGDIRAIGSGNIGATNVLRTGNKGLAAATLLLDALKGALAVLAVREYGHGGVLLGALAVFLGHLYPVWLNFKGGKGVATGLGVLFGLCWPVGLLCCAVWLAAAFLLRWSSVAALTAFAVAPFAAWGFQSGQSALLVALIALLVFWRHRANIRRLAAGTEPRIGQKPDQKPA